jgi:hypothetical protein
MKKNMAYRCCYVRIRDARLCAVLYCKLRERKSDRHAASRENERYIRIFRDGRATADHSRCFDRSRTKRHFGIR